ncbi:hypothetical protein HPB50_010902 [Hyalomma asiaticum]|uniref:Uncharacterized protein n=1 Tax=Hyalomma asiaticum TaxID=266040 RepID=A0ACB7SVE9_HYAAI|nr:hypothetical protein HPB50_010902 [Hyalomma asiaticum]
MSGESSLAFLHSIHRRRGVFNKGLNKGTAAASFAVLSLLGVSGMAAVLTLIMRDLRENEVKETSSLEVIRVALPVAPLRRNAAHPQTALDHRHAQSKHMASLSSGKVRAGIGKRGRAANGVTRANGYTSTFSRMDADASNDYDEHVRGSTDSDMAMDVTPQRNTTATDKNEPAFAGVEDYREPSNGFNVSVGTDEGGEAKGSKEILNYSLSTEEVFGSSSPPRLQGSPMHMSTLPSATRTTATSTAANTSRTKHTTLIPTADNPSDIDNPEKRNAGSSTWLLFCFYDDRSSTRSPGFSVYDFPVQLCTDVAFCCVDVNAKGQVVTSKNLELFLEAMAHEFLPRNHLFVTLGGHRALDSPPGRGSAKYRAVCHAALGRGAAAGCGWAGRLP